MAAIVEMDDLSGQDLYQKRPRPVGVSVTDRDQRVPKKKNKSALVWHTKVSMVAAVLLFPLLLKESQRSLHVISEETHTPNPVLFIKGCALDEEK
ncbi:hypothetical protein G5714_004136 [Onychostoma macrolepis]|uniref:Uncharacterized protein n=1 Tax=Onychostoma macrolepis TaxID=369639 RepID=A0A7J6DBF3_9TELE|nr:hypothetical protein G5714_004136 [Onychostoma macrolepis]